MAKTGNVQHEKRTEKTMFLACTLTATEFRDRAHELAKTTADIAEEEARGDSLKTQLKAAMTELEARRTKLSSIVQRGEEFRDIKVTVVSDYDAGEIYTIRADTGEIFDKRIMRAEERQVVAAL
jgi:chromosome segregation ATPase